jgi:beta-glucosidase/6-phospho-beta-glucosidase/beta-galactosidase
MPNCILQFPGGFLWGVATASHQNEGNNKLNDANAITEDMVERYAPQVMDQVFAD